MTVTLPVHTLPPARPLMTDPLTALREALDQLASLDGSLYSSKAELRLTAYHEAVCSLANVSGDKAQQVYDSNVDKLPSGTPVKDASPEELRRYTLALHGRARDRLTPGRRPRDPQEWYSFAGEAIHLYKQRQTA